MQTFKKLKKEIECIRLYFLVIEWSMGLPFIDSILIADSSYSSRKVLRLKSSTKKSKNPHNDVKIMPVSRPPTYIKVFIDEVIVIQIKIEMIPSAKTNASELTKYGKNSPVFLVFLDT